MNSKTNILKRLNKEKSVNSKSHLPEFNDSEIFSDYPANNNLLNVFKEKFELLKGELFIVSNYEEVAKCISEIISQSENKKCLTYSCAIIDKIFDSNQNMSTYFDFQKNREINSKKFSEYEIGLTSADYLIARTGSIVLRSISAGGRRISVLPPTHIVVAEKQQLVNSLDDIYEEKLISENTGSFATVITGPSRTSDIEKQLVLGAHGPKRLVVILIDV